jgi:hypothetical protein
MMVNSSNPIDLLIALHNGTCKGAVMTSAEWDSVYNYKEANIDCDAIPMPAYPNSVIRQFVGASLVHSACTVHFHFQPA